MKKVAIIMGSDSDLPTMQGAIDILKEFSISFSVNIVSAHRTPEYMQKFSKMARRLGTQIIIAGAGGAAHLPGMVASLTSLPVIGVPIQVGKLKGLDALLSIAQMPKGIPVATMAVDNSTNAGLLTVRILALNDKPLLKKLDSFHKKQTLSVAIKNRKIKKMY